MDVMEAIARRRSIKRFTDRAIPRATIETLLQAAVQAPNHHLTQPWRFYVLGPDARRAFGAALGARKAKKVEDPVAAQAVRDKVARTHEELPALIAVAMTQHDDAEKREEDYASVYMAVQNLSLAAVAQGLATHIKTGAVMQDPAARTAVGVAENERIVAMLEMGEPAEEPDAKARRPAAEFTTWLD